MNNGNGGQKSSGAWRDAPVIRGANIDARPGDLSPVQTPPTEHPKTHLTDAEKRQRTATNLARKRLLDAYKQSGENYTPAFSSVKPEGGTKGVGETKANTANQQRGEQISGPNAQISPAEWQQYHSAWQNYYQNYYGEYYGRAANEYLARERQKLQHEREELGIREGEKKFFQDDRDKAKFSADEKAVADDGSGGLDAAGVQQDYREKIRAKAAKRAGRIHKSRHLIPLGIGLTIILAGFLLQYNQVIMAHIMAYMSPGDAQTGEITSVDPTIAVAVHENPTLMIPKINVEVPVTFGSGNSLSEMANAMGNGVAHFSVRGASSLPGQIGNYAVSGHSAGNVYERSDYKFIFSGLTRMEAGDLIYMDYNSKRYTYKVTGTNVVDPSNVQALRDIADQNPGKPMITLITCTPLGTSKYRLLVYGEQIYPSYEGAESPDDVPDEVKPGGGNADISGVDGLDITDVKMPSNSDSPFEAFWKWITG